MAFTLRDDLTTRAAYVSDASIYRRLPAAILEVDGDDPLGDLRRGLALAAERGWPVVPRGGGTSIAGNSISTGLVLDHSRHHNRILAIDPEKRTARVQPGVVADQLTAAASPHGLRYGPDPSTHSRCTIGGMAGNNACGSHSVAWGTTAQSLVAARLLLADGREIAAGQGWCSDPDIEAGLRSLVTEHEDLIRTHLGRFPRQVSGYGLHYLLPEHGFDVAKMLAGSEGTLGIFTELTVNLVAPPKATALLVLGYADAYVAADAAAHLRIPGVYTIEGMDDALIAALRTRPGRERAGEELPAGGAWLYCEIGADDPAAVHARAEEIAALAASGFDGAIAGTTGAVALTDPVQVRRLWSIREAGAGITTRRADGGEAWPGWEDSAVPVAQLGAYLREFRELLVAHGLQGIPYGHFGEGCLHVRIDFELGTEQGMARYREFILDAARLAHSHGGSMSGEHGDGRARSELLAVMYPPEVLALFAQVKALFDPQNRLNPGVLVDPEPLDSGLRPGPGRDTHELDSGQVQHAFTRDGGSFAGAMNRCVGVGLCRAPGGGMCPSYQATKDEVHSTRGRARVLSEMLRGESLPGWESTEALEALDLCLSCKACATECPVNVDMATYKAEFLSHHYARGTGHRRPLAHYSMGWLPVAAAAVTAIPGLPALIRRVTSVRPVEKVILRAAGVEPRRRMIPFAQTSLRSWFAARRSTSDKHAARLTAASTSATAPVAATATTSAPTPGSAGTVLLWPDTFTNHNAPGVGVAAIEVLEALGYEVRLPEKPACCGLTWHSTGQLGMAKRALAGSLDQLTPALEGGWPIIALEPSCRVMLRDAADLLPDDPRSHQAEAAVVSLAQFVDRHAAAGGSWPFGTLDAKALAQVHCHQRAKEGYDADAAVLTRLGVDVDTISAGCCGLAGNFGFEPGHFEVSQACAEAELFPRIRAEAGPGGEKLVLADGFSCRTQIGQGTDDEGVHLAQLLRRALPR